MKKGWVIGILLVIVIGSLVFWFMNRENSSGEGPLPPSTWMDNIIRNDPNLVKVSECTYKSKKVFFFVGPECCDFINNVYNEKGEVICSFGGIMGQNTCPDFEASSCTRDVWVAPLDDDTTNCKVWNDDCNTCSRQDSTSSVACTMMACKERTGIKCLEYFNGT